MRKLNAFVKRNILETIREPLSLIFCLGFPVVMLVFMQIIFTNIEIIPENFKIEHYAMGICVFGYTFTSMFISMNIAGDKNSSLIKRIEISPTSKTTYLLSYIISGLLMTLIQTLLFFVLAFIFGLPFSLNSVLAFIYLLPSAIFYLTIGIIIGLLCKNEKQTGPISSIIITLVGILGGIFMPLSAFSGGFLSFVNSLPFAHSVEIASQIYLTGASCIYPHILYVVGYTCVLWLIIILIIKFNKK